MSTKENSFEIGDLVRLKFTHTVGIVVDKKDSREHYYSYKIKWQTRHLSGPQGSQWYPAQQLQPAY